MQKFRFTLHLLVFPVLQLMAMLGLWMLPLAGFAQLALVCLAAFLLNWNLHVSVHHLVHHPPKHKGIRNLCYLFASLLLGLPFHYYQLIHRNHHFFNNEPGDFTSTWKLQDDKLKQRPFWSYVLFWWVPTVPLRKQIETAKAAGWLSQKGARFLRLELLLLLLFYGLLFLIVGWKVLLYALLVYLGWVLISAQNYGQHLPTDPEIQTTSIHKKWYNYLTLNNGLHHEHHQKPQLSYDLLEKDQNLKAIEQPHLTAGFWPKAWRGSFVVTVLVILGLLAQLPNLQMTGSLDGFAAGATPVFNDARAYDSIFGQSKYRYYWSITPSPNAKLSFLSACTEFEQALKAQTPELELLSSARQLRKFSQLRLYPKHMAASDFLKIAAKHPQLGKLISKDERSFLLIADYHGVAIPLKKVTALQEQARPQIQEIRGFGMQGLEAAIASSMQEDIVTITGLIFILFGAYLFWRYRHWSAIVYLVGNMLLSIILTVCLFPVFGFQMTVVSILALPIVLVLSLSDAIHLLGGLAKGQTSSATISKIWVPSLLSSLTTAIAFYSFYFNDAPNMVQLGMVTGTAVLLEFLVSMAMAQQFLHMVRLRKAESQLMRATSHFLERRQKAIGWALLGLVLVAVFMLPKLRFDASTDDFFPDGHPVTKEHAYFRSQFDAQKVLHLWFDKQDNAAQQRRQVEAWLGQQQAPQLIGYDFKPKSAEQPLAASIYFSDTKAIGAFYKKLERQGELRKQHLGLHAYSPFVVFDVVNQQVAASLFWSLLTASSAIVLLMLWLTQNPLQALLGFVPNLVPLAAVVVFFVGFDQGLNMLTALTLVVCVGLLDDDTIHVLYQKYVLRAPIAQMNPVIIHAAVLLALGFGCFVLSNFKPTRLFGGVSALVFVVGLLGELTLFQWILNQFKKENNDQH
jgi:predicted RND superfamily exporter protein/fatty acid desaturase